VIYERSESFKRDYKSMAAEWQILFKSAVRRLNTAYEDADGAWPVSWPADLRIKPTHAAGIWEMTWSFSSPDGRATFEFFATGGVRGVRWRRVGTHEVLP
jgi:hypothetical protein